MLGVLGLVDGRGLVKDRLSDLTRRVDQITRPGLAGLAVLGNRSEFLGQALPSRLAKNDAFAAILVPSIAITPASTSPALTHRLRTWPNRPAIAS